MPARLPFQAQNRSAIVTLWSAAESAQAGIPTERQECSFLKKRTKKLLHYWFAPVGNSATANKRFLLLLFKKENLSCCPIKRPP